jgi:hypothetical protein
MADDALRTNYTGVAFRGSIHELSESPLFRELARQPYYVLVVPGRYGPDVYMQPHSTQQVLKELLRHKGELPPNSNGKFIVTVVDMRAHRIELRIGDSTLIFSIQVSDPVLVAEQPIQDPVAVILDFVLNAPEDYVGPTLENWARITTDDRLLAYRIRVETGFVSRMDSDNDGIIDRRRFGRKGGLGRLRLENLGFIKEFTTSGRSTHTASHDLGSAAIWVSGSRSQGRELADAIKELLVEYGVDLEEAGPERHGSWWQRFRMKASRLLASDEAAKRLEAVERGISAHLLEKQVAENDNLKADSVSKLMDKLDNIEKAVIILGQLVIVKHEGSLTIKSIDPLTAAKIEASEVLLSDPVQVLHILTRPREAHAEASLTTHEFSKRGGDRPPLPGN